MRLIEGHLESGVLVELKGQLDHRASWVAKDYGILQKVSVGGGSLSENNA